MNRNKHAVVLVIAAGAVVAALVLAVTAWVGGDSNPSAAPAVESVAGVCRDSSRASWQKLANEIKAPVFCPTWLPDPLDGRFDGVFNGQTVDPDRSYLVKFLWFESGLPGGPQEVHVVLRGYPGNPRLPQCDNSTVEGDTIVHHFSPCFSDPKGKKRFGSKLATLYTSNQGADQWHLVYAWHHQGSLYSLSEHVSAPYTYKQVLANLDRMMRTLVRVAPNRGPRS